MKLKELLEVSKESIILLCVPEEDSLIDNYSQSLEPYSDREVVSVKAFYQRSGLFKYGLLVEVNENDK